MAEKKHGKFWAFTRKVFFTVRTVALTVFLVLAYVVGVGFTRIVTLPLPRRWIGVQRQKRTPYWIAAEPRTEQIEKLSEPF